MTQEQSNKTVWWGTFEFNDEDAARWYVGPSTLWIHRSMHSWYIVHSEVDEREDDVASFSRPQPIAETSLSLDDLPPGAAVARYSFQKTDRQLSIMPVLADRAVVVQPEVPLFVLPGEEVTIYVSTPLWIRLEVGAEGRLLREVPSHRPSDTWFGPSTRDGELCYALKTTARLRLQSLPVRMHRAVTPIRVKNNSGAALNIDRVQLPVQYLSLYEGDNGRLWTESLTLEREPGGELTTVRFDKITPLEAGEVTLLRGPRIEVRTNVITRTFSSFFNRLTVED